MKKAMLAITMLIFGAITAFSQVTIASYRGTQVEPQGGGDLCDGHLELVLKPGLALYCVSVSHRTNPLYSEQRQIGNPETQFIDGFVSLFGSQVENFSQAGLTFDGTLVYGRFRNIYGDILTDDHVKALFKLADDVPASLLSDVRIQLDNNPALKARLLESDFFLKFRKLENSIPDLSDLEKSDLLKDLVDNPGEFLDYMEDLGGNKVRAWETLFEYPVFRKNVDYLDYTDDYLTRTGKTKQQFLGDLDEFVDPKHIFLDELDDTPASGIYANNPSGVWNENPFVRGNAIEDVASVPGIQTPPTFPKIDYYDAASETATSVKSTDLFAKTYQDITKLEDLWKSYVDDISGQIYPLSQGDLIIGDIDNPVSNRVLHIVTLHDTPLLDQQSIINTIQNYASSGNVTIIFENIE